MRGEIVEDCGRMSSITERSQYATFQQIWKTLLAGAEILALALDVGHEGRSILS
jgi:hypothetical protein